ncbi:MAG TPA: HEAT repeat domain-containing protein [Vicinamibacterales bacterium]|nr:HEAT repeat domain-containing protein [Vicinamibacterales bacterium]
MAIKPSSQKTVDALVRDLSSDRAVTRDTAIARLTVIGARAVARLSAIVADRANTPGARVSALKALDAIADPRSLDVALPALADGDVAVAVAAVGVARALFGSPRGVEAVDRMTAIALDASQPRDVRRAATRALGDLPASTVAPVFKALASDSDAHIAQSAAEAVAPLPAKRPSARDALQRWTESDMLEDPDALRRVLLAQHGAGIPLPSMLQLIQKLHEREDAEKPGRRASWTTARAAAHAALAQRGSRIALYDLKETLESASEPLPVEFLTALTGIGDASCLEAIAAAYAKAVKKRSDEWWRRHLLAAFHEIVRREKITSRHAAMKRVQKRWPQVLGVRD